MKLSRRSFVAAISAACGLALLPLKLLRKREVSYVGWGDSKPGHFKTLGEAIENTKAGGVIYVGNGHREVAKSFNIVGREMSIFFDDCILGEGTSITLDDRVASGIADLPLRPNS